MSAFPGGSRCERLPTTSCVSENGCRECEAYLRKGWSVHAFEGVGTYLPTNWTIPVHAFKYKMIALFHGQLQCELW